MDIANLTYPVYFIPTPSSDNYTSMQITRYFAQKINTGEIFEIPSDNYREISTFLYNKVSLIWYISGPRNNVKQGNVIIQKGVVEQNQESLKIAEKTMCGIKDYLNDLTQFYKQS